MLVADQGLVAHPAPDDWEIRCQEVATSGHWSRPPTEETDSCDGQSRGSGREPA
jgi:hypothetical protein